MEPSPHHLLYRSFHLPPVATGDMQEEGAALDRHFRPSLRGAVTAPIRYDTLHVCHGERLLIRGGLMPLFEYLSFDDGRYDAKAAPPVPAPIHPKLGNSLVA